MTDSTIPDVPIKWFYDSRGKRVGPLSTDAVRKQLQQGEITLDTLVWNLSFGQEWKPLFESGIVDCDGLPPPLPAFRKSGNTAEVHPSGLGNSLPAAVGVSIRTNVVGPTGNVTGHRARDDSSEVTAKAPLDLEERVDNSAWREVRAWIGIIGVIFLILMLLRLYLYQNPAEISSNSQSGEKFQKSSVQNSEVKSQISTVVGKFSGARISSYGELEIDLFEGTFSNFRGTLAQGEENALIRFNLGETIQLRCRMRDSALSIPRGENCHIIR